MSSLLVPVIRFAKHLSGLGFKKTACFTRVCASVSSLTFTDHLYLPPAATSLNVTPQRWPEFALSLVFCLSIRTLCRSFFHIASLLHSLPLTLSVWISPPSPSSSPPSSPSPPLHSSRPLRGEAESGRVWMGGHSCHHGSFETFLPRAPRAAGALRLLHRHRGDSQWVTGFCPIHTVWFIRIRNTLLVPLGEITPWQLVLLEHKISHCGCEQDLKRKDEMTRVSQKKDNKY